MKFLSRATILVTLILSTHQANSSGYEPETEEGKFRLYTMLNKALPEGMCSHTNVGIAWQHQERIRTMLRGNADLFPHVLPDGEVATFNKMGFHWGYAPSITVALSQLIKADQQTEMLEVGSCYGFDTIALIMQYPLLRVTCVELDRGHTDLMKALMEKTLTEGQQGRVEILTGDFMDALRFGSGTSFAEKRFNLAVVSKVLHFYEDEDNVNTLKQVNAVLNPGGHVVMSHMANKCHRAIEAASSICGGYMPQPESLVARLTCRGSLKWLNYFSQASMERIATNANFEVVNNTYVGTVHDKASAFYSWLPGYNPQQCILHSVLQKNAGVEPEEDEE